MIDFFKVAAEDTYFNKTLSNDAIKITAHAVETYRKLVRHLK